MTALDVSVAVFADDAAPVFLHATLKAARRAIGRLRDMGASAELVLFSQDRNALPAGIEDPGTAARPVVVPATATCHRAMARGMLAEVCTGRYIACVEAGDMWSADWLCAALEGAPDESSPCSVWRPEVVIGCGLDFFSDRGLFMTFQTAMTERRDGTALFFEMPYAPTFFVRRDVLAKVPFPKPDVERGWTDIDTWWTADVLGAGHAQRIVSGTFLYRWNKGDGKPPKTRIGPTSLDAGFVPTAQVE